jgi:hypothetical protein
MYGETITRHTCYNGVAKLEAEEFNKYDSFTVRTKGWRSVTFIRKRDSTLCYIIKADKTLCVFDDVEACKYMDSMIYLRYTEGGIDCKKFYICIELCKASPVYDLTRELIHFDIDKATRSYFVYEKTVSDLKKFLREAYEILDEYAFWSHKYNKGDSQKFQYRDSFD